MFSSFWISGCLDDTGLGTEFPDLDPGTPLTNFTDGVSDRGSYFIPKKSQLQNLSTQKNHYLAYPKKIP